MDTSSDLTIQVSLLYLDMIESILPVHFDSVGNPVCIPELITESQLLQLNVALNKLLLGWDGEQARKSAEKFGEENVQTIAFGNVSDLDMVVKLGLVYGDRVVLWDIIASRLLVRKEVDVRMKITIAQIACDLLLLRSAVALGGVVILPHPIFWSAVAQEIDAEVRGGVKLSASQLGLSFAIAAANDGMPLHPYTLLVDDETPIVSLSTSPLSPNLYSIENVLYQRGVAALLSDVRMQFLQDVSVAKFYEILHQHSPMKIELRKHFSRNLSGLSKQQADTMIRSLVSDVVTHVTARNRVAQAYVSSGAIASFSLVSSALTAVSGVGGLTALSMLGIAPAALLAVREWWNRPDRNLVVQAFKALSDAHGEEDVMSNHALPYLLSKRKERDVDPEIAGHVDAFMSAGSWTENKHDYLMSLGPGLAKRVLRALEPEQLDVVLNYRRRQEDYIGDYLEDVWEIDETAFWEHMDQTFQSYSGIIQYDGFEISRIMSSVEMPLKTWIFFINSLLPVYGPLIVNRNLDSYQHSDDYSVVTSYQLEMVEEILKFQLEYSKLKLEKREAFGIWLNTLSNPDRGALLEFLSDIYESSLPIWVVDNVRT